jgi:hypothetical protein
MRINLSKHTSLGTFGLTILWVATACASASSPTLTAFPSDTPTSTSSPTATLAASPLPSETPIPSVACFETYYDPFAFLPNSLILLVRAEMGVQLFNLETMQSVKFIQAPNIIDGPAVALSPDNILAWAFTDGTIQLIRMQDQQPIFTKQSGQSSPIKLEFSPTQDYLYSIAPDSLLHIWDMSGTYWEIYTDAGELANISISPDGNKIALIPVDGPVALMSLEHLELVRKLGGTGGSDTSDAVFSPDGQYLAANLATGLHVWSMADGKELLGDDSPVYSMAVAYSPDGKYLAYADINNLVLSSPDGSKIIRSLSGHQTPIFRLLFSPDSSLLVSADDLEMRVWQVEDGELLAVGKRECR